MNTMAAAQDRYGDVNRSGEEPLGSTLPTATHRKGGLGRSAALLLAGAAVMGGIGKAHDRGGEIIATVNGSAITRQDLTRRLESASGNAVLQQMIGDEMQLQFARQRGVLPDDAQVKAKYEAAGKQPDFARNLALTHQTPDDVKHAIRLSLINQEALTKNVHVSGDDIQAFYARNVDKTNASARYYHPETVVVAAIISDKEADIDHALHELAAGKAFAHVAQAYSRDTSKANGGLLAPIQRTRFNAKQFPGMEAQLFSLTPGQQVDKVKVAGAWWTIRCIEKSPERTDSFEQVQAECRTGAMLTKGLPANAAALQADFAAFRKAADVKIVSPDYRAAQPSK